ncbi:hypothetical protein OAO24_05345 [Methylophilaceae bacterium]|jgi:hypothetical protein|nr:hypothetical protein [Methylophilaceae bacterium]
MKKLLLLLFLIPNLVMALPPCVNPDSIVTECKGTKIFPNGDKYEGEWKNNKMHGQGTYTYADGEKYVGEYKDGQVNGQGSYVWASGAKYEGEWKDDKMHGQGDYTYPSGSRYLGEYKYGKRHGVGVITMATGNTYEGEWKDDKMHGQGSYTWAEGKVFKGKFINGDWHPDIRSVSSTNFQLSPMPLQTTPIAKIILYDTGEWKAPLEGGYGYSKDDAVVIDKNHVNASEPFYGVGIQRKYRKYRAWKEFGVNENHGFFGEGQLNLKLRFHTPRDANGKVYDVHKYEICGEEILLNDKKEPIKDSKNNYIISNILCYDTEYWFEISSYYGQSLSIKKKD